MKFLRVPLKMNLKFGNFFRACMLILLCVSLNDCGNQKEIAAKKSVELTMVFGINDAARNLKADTTVLSVMGVVQTIRQQDHLITLIDVEEFELCGLSDCCLYLPVRWRGEMPKLKDLVTVSGKIDSTESGLLFTAAELYVQKSAETK